ncbi:MAG: hypothetical protein NZQ09_12095, partial [Chloroflexus sp.]|nr:hypothetical protein [Chloroflexus sp.]
LGNPPWERIKLQEQEHFADVPAIARAANKAERERLIRAWRNGDAWQRARIAAYDAAKYRADAESRFVRASGRFPLTAVGDVNTYALFAEHARSLLAPAGRAGIIVPTGIATDDSTKAFFGDLNERRQLISLYDFENREAIFPGVHRSYKFSLLTIGSTDQPARFVFFATDVSHLTDPQRVFTLTPADLALINPNTQTAPVFRTCADAELTTAIYRRVPVLVNERTGENPWGVSFRQGLFNMTSDSHLFHPAPGAGLLPLYEAKLLHQFTHRWATYAAPAGRRGEPQSRELTAAELADPAVTVTPRYWVPAAEVEKRLAGRWERQWLLGWRDITNATNERTAIFSLLPRVGVGGTAYLMLFTGDVPVTRVACLMAVVNSLVFDYVTRQKIGGTHLNIMYLTQLPVLPPSAFSADDLRVIVPRVVELVYTAWDMRPFAADVWAEAGDDIRQAIWQRWRACHGAVAGDEQTVPPPFRWDDERRAQIRAELDARIARRYGLSRDELRYILDPADVYGDGFPGETFRVLKANELRQYGEYRTRRLVLAAWDGDEA